MNKEFANWKSITVVEKDGTEITIDRKKNNASLMGWSYSSEFMSDSGVEVLYHTDEGKYISLELA